MSSTSQPSRPSGTSAPFESTQWTVILEAKSGSTCRREALETLCRAYWLPLYGYLRRRGHSAADAEDLTQGFFAYILEGDFLDRPDPAKGRFRGYLLGALKHYLGSHFEKAGAQKRGGGVSHVPWDQLDMERAFSALDDRSADPSGAYERGWALTLIDRAVQRLESEQSTQVRRERFTCLKPFLSGAPTTGDYDRVAEQLGMTRTNVAVAIHRLNHRFSELVRLEVAATVQDPADVSAEMEHLRVALRG